MADAKIDKSLNDIIKERKIKISRNQVTTASSGGGAGGRPGSARRGGKPGGRGGRGGPGGLRRSAGFSGRRSGGGIIKRRSAPGGGQNLSPAKAVAAAVCFIIK